MLRTVTVLDVDLEVEFTATPYRPAVMYLSNGDPGYPAEGGEIEVTDVFLDDVSVVKLLSDWTMQQIQTKLEEIDFESEAAEMEADYKIERRQYDEHYYA